MLRILLVAVLAISLTNCTRADEIVESILKIPHPSLEEISGEEAAELLRLIAEHQTASYDGIRTWTGTVGLDESFRVSKARVTERQIDPLNGGRGKLVSITGPLMLRRLLRIHFALDVSANFVFTESEIVGPTQYQHLKTEKRFQHDFENHTLTLRRNYEVYTKDIHTNLPVFPDLPGEVAVPRTVSELITKSAFSDRSTFGRVLYDPRSFFQSGGMRIDHQIQRCADRVVDPELASFFTVARSQNGQYIYFQRSFHYGPTSQRSYYLIVCDSDVNFLPVKLTTFIDEVPIESKVWQYQESADEWVPKEFNEVKRNSSGEISVERKFRFLKTDVNISIPPDQFELSVFDPEDGDQLVDRTTDQKFIFRDGQPQLVTDEGRNP